MKLLSNKLFSKSFKRPKLKSPTAICTEFVADKYWNFSKNVCVCMKCFPSVNTLPAEPFFLKLKRETPIVSNLSKNATKTQCFYYSARRI